MQILVVFLFLLISINTFQWNIVADEGPQPRYINQLTYANGGLFLFGGKNNESNGFDDLWEWKNGKWNALGTGATKRWDHSYTYMQNLDQIFLFGGRSFIINQGNEERTDLNDNWIYKVGKWQELDIISPEPRSSHGLVFHQNNSEVILFGGRNKEQVFGDTWGFNGQAWKKLNVEGPDARFGHTLSYDPGSKTTYLFGGHDGKNLLNDFWAFDGEKWLEIKSENKISPRMAHAMQFDNDGNGILFGGWDGEKPALDELWLWKDNQWTLVDIKKGPQARLSHSLGFDRVNNTFILFGGSTGFNGQFLSETWELKISR